MFYVGFLCFHFRFTILILSSSIETHSLPMKASCALVAERTGFEPVKPFRGLHAFQACLFNHSSISPNMCVMCGCSFLRLQR